MPIKYYSFSRENIKLKVGFEGNVLTNISFNGKTNPTLLDSTKNNHNLSNVYLFLSAFFNQDFDLATKIRSAINYQINGTNFQLKVWKAISDLNAGETISYQQLASIVKHPGACRAVGSACGKNPLPIFIPCHRVVASNNKLGGYNGGAETKKWLLTREGVNRLGTK